MLVCLQLLLEFHWYKIAADLAARASGCDLTMAFSSTHGDDIIIKQRPAGAAATAASGAGSEGVTAGLDAGLTCFPHAHRGTRAQDRFSRQK